MDLVGIKKTQNCNNYGYSKQLQNTAGYYNAVPNFKSSLNKDTFDDGKISLQDSAKHFIKGILSPITSMFNSPKALLTGVGSIAIVSGICAACPPLIPVMVASGVITGGIQLIKGAKNAITAKTDKEAESAFETIGTGTFSLGTSMIGAQKALKAAGINDAKANTALKATIECFKSIPSNITKSYKMIKNGTAWVNFKNTIVKPSNFADIEDLKKLKEMGYDEQKLSQIKEFSEILHKEGLNSVDENTMKGSSIDEIRDILPDELKEKVHYRVKSESSIKDKLIKKLADEKIDNIEDARNIIGDLVGCNIIMDGLTDAQTDVVVESLAQALKQKRLKILTIENYKGEGTEAYLTSDHMDLLREVSKSHDTEINSFDGFGTRDIADKVKPSGYTTAQLNIKFEDGTLGELQIRGDLINKLANAEHVPYDLRQGKDLSSGNHLLRKLYKPLENNVKLLSNKGYSEYNNYLNALYKYYREVETGSNTNGLNKPKITDYITSSPKKFIKNSSKMSSEEVLKIYSKVLNMLDIDNIQNLHNDANWLKEIPKTTMVKAIKYGSLGYLTNEHQESVIEDS